MIPSSIAYLYWSAWSSWGACTASCGGMMGTQTSTRSCAANCAVWICAGFGPSTQSQACIGGAQLHQYRWRGCQMIKLKIIINHQRMTSTIIKRPLIHSSFFRHAQLLVILVCLEHMLGLWYIFSDTNTNLFGWHVRYMCWCSNPDPIMQQRFSANLCDLLPLMTSFLHSPQARRICGRRGVRGAHAAPRVVRVCKLRCVLALAHVGQHALVQCRSRSRAHQVCMFNHL